MGTGGLGRNEPILYCPETVAIVLIQVGQVDLVFPGDLPRQAEAALTVVIVIVGRPAEIGLMLM
jgi:hypothetical protein